MAKVKTKNNLVKDAVAQEQGDVVFLLDQLHTIEHAQDRQKIREIEKKYNYKPYWA